MTVQQVGGTWFNEPDINEMTTPEQRRAALAVATPYVQFDPELIAMLGLGS